MSGSSLIRLRRRARGRRVYRGQVIEGWVGGEKEGSIDGVKPQVPFGKRSGEGAAVEEMGSGVRM